MQANLVNFGALSPAYNASQVFQAIFRPVSPDYNAGDSASGERQIQGLSAVNSKPSFARVVTEQGLTFARGRRVDLEFDEEYFPGGGMFLFASVMERFLSLHTTMNSFVQVALHSKQRKRVVREWAPRSGNRTLL